MIMRKIVIFLLFFLISTALSYSHDFLKEANNCMKKGDYKCVEINLRLYHEDTGKDVSKQIGEAEKCQEYRSSADAFFEANNYVNAEAFYKKILVINPKDNYTKKQYDLCLKNKGENVSSANLVRAEPNNGKQVVDEKNTQDTQVSETTDNKIAFKRNNKGNNWFINIGVGAQTIFGDNDTDASLTDRITIAPTLSVGNWFSPFGGVRLKVQGGILHGFEENGAYMQHLSYYNVHVDALWNLANYWGVYSSYKTFNFTPYVGLGLAHKFGYDEDVAIPVASNENGKYHHYSNVLSVNPGIMLGFRLSNRVNLYLDLGTAIVPDDFDRIVNRMGYEAIIDFSLGIKFYF
jgi:hypothetical protein